MDIEGTLKELSSLCAPSGSEKRISGHIRSIFMKYCGNVTVDKFMNVTGVMRGTGNNAHRVMIMAHYDEVGMIVKSIDDRGFVKLAAIGDIDPRMLPAQEVVIHGRRDITGVIGAKPLHLLKPEDADKAAVLDELTVDTGMDAASVRNAVSIGDSVTIRSYPELMQNRFLRAKAMDDRSGLAALVNAMELLSASRFTHDIVFVASVQEELSLTGAVTATYNVSPCAAVVIDVCHGDTPDSGKDETCILGKGPAIGVGPNMHKVLTRKLMDTAARESIPYQFDPEPGDSGTDAWAVQVSGKGVPTVLLSIPVRYMHTPVETVSIEDVSLTARLAARFAETEGICA